MDIEWEDGFKINVSSDNHAVTISANKEGLLSLAKHFMALANEMPGTHIHYDEHNALEDNSTPLIIEKID